MSIVRRINFVAQERIDADDYFMQISFVTASGHKIEYYISGVLTHHDVCAMADMYGQVCPDTLPTHVWIHPSLYKDFATTMGNKVPVAIENGRPCLLLSTGSGILLCEPVPYGFTKFQVLVGTQEDYDRYFLDEVFEKTVLADCEKE